VRWQLEGWAQAGQQVQHGEELGPQAGETAAGRVIKLTLVPEEVCPDEGRQLGFWGNDAAVDTRAARALARVQGLLGPDAALTGVLQGGRDYMEQVHLVPWGEPRVPIRPGAPASSVDQSQTGSARAGTSKARRSQRATAKPGSANDGTPPWPGHLPGLAPAVVHQPPLPAQVTGESGDPVCVGSRGTASARPTRFTIGGGKQMSISAWAGPWPLEERWWDAGGRRRARFQVCTVEGAAYLLAREGRRWWVEATYD
jgi:protein ImuB